MTCHVVWFLTFHSHISILPVSTPVIAKQLLNNSERKGHCLHHFEFNVVLVHCINIVCGGLDIVTFASSEEKQKDRTKHLKLLNCTYFGSSIKLFKMHNSHFCNNSMQFCGMMFLPLVILCAFITNPKETIKIS